MRFLSDIKNSVEEFKNIKSMTGAALMSALHIILGFCKIIISATFEIRFAFLALAAAGFLYGPIVAGVVGVIGDIISFAIRPNGFFFPGFTFNEFVYGFIYGLFFYRKKVTLKRIVGAELVATVAINIVLTPIWLNIMYGTKLFALPKLIKTVIMFPAECAVMYFVLTTVESIVANRKTNL